MLCKNNCSYLLLNGVLLQSIILLVMISATSVFGDEDTPVTCKCERSALNLFKKRGYLYPDNVCTGSTDPTASCSSGWCFKAVIDIAEPKQGKGTYKEKGCAPKRTKEDKKCDEIPLNDGGTKATIESCFCNESMCNVDISGAFSFKPTKTVLISSSLSVVFLIFGFVS